MCHINLIFIIYVCKFSQYIMFQKGGQLNCHSLHYLRLITKRQPRSHKINQNFIKSYNLEINCTKLVFLIFILKNNIFFFKLVISAFYAFACPFSHVCLSTQHYFQSILFATSYQNAKPTDFKQLSIDYIQTKKIEFLSLNFSLSSCEKIILKSFLNFGDRQMRILINLTVSN